MPIWCLCVLKCVKLSQLYMLRQLHGSIHGRWQTNPLEWVTRLNVTFRCLSKCDLHKSVNVRVYEQNIQNHISFWNERETAIKKKEKRKSLMLISNHAVFNLFIPSQSDQSFSYLSISQIGGQIPESNWRRHTKKRLLHKFSFKWCQSSFWWWSTKGSYRSVIPHISLNLEKECR